MATLPPNQTLYVSNLNDKIRKPDLRISLYTLFSTYGVVLDVVALKTMKHRGQAHVAFRDVAAATNAMRELQGMGVFGKEMRISYAKGKSHKIAKLDGTMQMLPATAGAVVVGDGAAFVPVPGAVAAAAAAAVAAAAEPVVGQKRMREDEDEEEEEEEEAEMEMEDD